MTPWPFTYEARAVPNQINVKPENMKLWNA